MLNRIRNFLSSREEPDYFTIKAPPPSLEKVVATKRLADGYTLLAIAYTDLYKLNAGDDCLYAAAMAMDCAAEWNLRYAASRDELGL